MKTLADILARCIEEGDCLLWQQGTTGQGYPCAAFNGLKTVNVRRWVLEQLGHDMTGRRSMSRCRNRLCLAEKHLFPATRDQANKWLGAQGLLSTPAVRASRTLTARSREATKLDMAKARQMRERRADGAVLTAIASEFGVSADTAWKVIHHMTWREATRGASVFNL